MPNETSSETITAAPASPSTTSATAPGSAPRRAPSVPLIVATVSSVLLVACLVWALSLRGELARMRVSSSQAIEAHLKTIVMQTQQVEALDRLAARVDQFNREFGASVGKLQMNESLEAGVADLKGRAHLPDEAKKTLEEFEQSLTAIGELTAKMQEFERFLGAPSVVKRGESHSQIARRYLVEEAKLDPKEADRVLRRTALAWELEPGNLVFNLFHEGTLLTTVAQGTAKRSPLMAQWSRREAVNARMLKLEEELGACRSNAAAAAAAPAPAGEPAAQPDAPAAVAVPTETTP